MRSSASRSLLIAASVVIVLAACSSDGATGVYATTAVAKEGPDSMPDSIVVLGHSGATGYNSDPNHLTRDATENSWATGDNPDVQSLYLRVLAQNPAVKDHNFNLARDGSTVRDLRRQAQASLSLVPLPELVVIQTVDNDIRCDGTDAQNYGAFGGFLVRALDIVAQGNPDAHVFIVSSPWATVENYTDVVEDIPAAPAALSGSSPCHIFDETGKRRPDRMAYLQDVIDHYHAEVSTVCNRYPNCRYDGGAFSHMVIGPDDLSTDFNHPSIQGHKKAAATAWAAFTAP